VHRVVAWAGSERCALETALLVQDHLLPSDYVLLMRAHALDKCPVSSYEEVSRIVREDLGAPPHELFADFERAPIASASLAQVPLLDRHSQDAAASPVVRLLDKNSRDAAASPVVRGCSCMGKGRID
jgi:ABC1 atypical kinase-like domain